MAAAEETRLRIEALSSRHDRRVFACGVKSLDRYLRQQPSQDLRKHVSATFVLVEGVKPAVLGFYTLSAANLRLGDLPEIFDGLFSAF